MPPRKEKFSKDGSDLQELIQNYRIYFEGPVPPSMWPKQHEHLFRGIRDIWATRFDEYEQRTDIDRNRKEDQIQRVNSLRDRAYSLREDVNINEGTWRTQVEPLVIQRFEERIICEYCGSELYEAEYKAEPIQNNISIFLRDKRSNRNSCNCNKDSKVTEDPDDELGHVFRNVTEIEVTHSEHEAAHLNKKSVSIKPDRVIGLTKTEQFRTAIRACQHNLAHEPLKGVQMLYPFLVIEAKKGKDAPGFRSIERQTAFPIRRLLNMQRTLMKSCHISAEPALVWFFAYQGEDWRVYGATVEDVKTRVYDLWHGTIESHDGALQLLQIVDYIWTWARDIYRPQIKACLLGDDPRAAIPSFLRSMRSLSVQSISSDSSVSSSEPVADPKEPRNSESGNDIEQDIEMEIDELPTSQKDVPQHKRDDDFSRNYPPGFRQWIIRHTLEPELSHFGTIRHSNIVSFSFHIRKISDVDLYLSTHTSDFDRGERATLLKLEKISVSFRVENLIREARVWSNDDTLNIDSHGHETVRASFLFQTRCRPEDWHIVRDVYCIVWPLREPDTGRLLSRPTKVVNHAVEHLNMDDIRGLRGQRSSWAALDAYTLVGATENNFRRGLSWRRPMDVYLSTNVMHACVDLLQEKRLFSAHWSSSTVANINDWNSGAFQQYRFLNLPGLTRPVEPSGALIAVKPEWWPEETPKFCLFVHQEKTYDNARVLENLLEQTLRQRKFYGNGVIAADKVGLNDWLRWLKSQPDEVEIEI
ncbi:hypothetical protein K469DRAFT_755936 [Zopfia rhizophila CBS 207.26]|uniref:Uncharacterized protein n=1 Tax=Zopfia rhizophila CBS 207.26 TaxID=1314779 RepID=A0A6A6DDB9_9PEZI|nr:hypothetical protein K469DRAFT_755936 [Zopfia rhizophila CBS 207.26]